jgi:isopentenyl-diphosphate Delta-isomerase
MVDLHGLDLDVLILVDETDRGVGYLSKAQCHHGQGILHRAFSLLIFNGNGELLIQRRAASKRLWPLYWSNSCCSHPRGAETLETAAQRRLREELGISCELRFLYKFQYQAQFDATGAENELCSVFIGRSDEAIKVNRDEILDWRWISPEALREEMRAEGGRTFTPWFMLEWARIWREHRPAVRSLVI